MDIALNLPNSNAVIAAPTQIIDRAATKKIAPINANDKTATRPSEKPLVAQVVSARLSGAEFPDNPSEIMPSERTLRPYDVPMLPSRDDERVEHSKSDIADQGLSPASKMPV